MLIYLKRIGRVSDWFLFVGIFACQNLLLLQRAAKQFLMKVQLKLQALTSV